MGDWRNRQRMKKFLVGYDGTEPSREAGLVAARLAKRLRAMVTVLTVGQPTGGGITAMAPHVDESAFLSIAEEGAEIVRAHGVIVEARTESGEPALVLVEVAAREGHDLVVVGHRGLGIKELFVGSVAKKVATDAPCPVLVVRGAAPEVIAKVLAATDGSESAKVALEAAAVLGKAFDASFTLLYVIDEQVWAAALRSPLSREHRRTLEQIAVEALSKAIEGCRNTGVKCDVIRVIGKPADVICRLAHDGGYDLVAVGRHRRSGVARLILGSVSDEVLRKAGPLQLLASERTIDQPGNLTVF